MNQRIKQLIDQATFHNDRYALPDEFGDQLSSLIVDECLRILYLNGYDDAVDCLTKELKSDT
jgi:hypothetical protein